MSITLYDLFGITAGPNAEGEAAALWRARGLNTRLSTNSDWDMPDDSDEIVRYLNESLVFRNIRPGANASVGSAGQLTLTAELQVSPAPATTLYLRDLPDIGIGLLPTTPDAPARCFVSIDDRGFEVIIEGLPVVLKLDTDVLRPSDDSSVVGDATRFEASRPDEFATVFRQEPEGSEIYVVMRLQLTPEGDVILEPNVPLSFGESTFLGIPVRAVHDLQILPSPHRGDYLEWARHDLTGFKSNPPVRGALGFRSVDFDGSKSPLSDLIERIRGEGVDFGQIELVCEDVVFPVGNAYGIFPIPSHGTFGFRRKIADRFNAAQAFSLGDSGGGQSVTYPDDLSLKDETKEWTENRWAGFTVTAGNAQGTVESNVDKTLTLRAPGWTPSIPEKEAAYSFGAPLVFPLYPMKRRNSGNSSGWRLVFERMFVKSGVEPPIDVLASVVYQGEQGGTVGGSVAVTDDWTIQLGIVLGDESPVKLTIADSIITVHSFKLGLSIGRLTDSEYDFTESYQILADLSVRGDQPAADTKNDFFKIRSLTGKPLDMILRDVGWSFGELALSGLAMPEGVQLIFADTFRIIIEEMGWVEEPNGSPYFSFSGGVALGFGGGDAVQPRGVTEDKKSSSGMGLRVRRLRFRLTRNSDDPRFRIDGISLDLRYGTVGISGFGFITDATEGAFRIRELGFGAAVQLGAIGNNFTLAAQFVKGSRIETLNPSNAFNYLLAALSLSNLPVGAISLYGIRALFAYNMTPNVAAAPDGAGMALYQWHRRNANSIKMPATRDLADWVAQDRSLAVGAGFGFALNASPKLAHLNLFLFVAHSEADTGLLIAGELFLGKNAKPVGFAAIEYSVANEKFGAMIGVDLTIKDLVGPNLQLPGWLAELATLSGNIYFGNQPWTIAIGQLRDQRTWLSVRTDIDSFIKLNLQIGGCLQIVEGGDKGVGVVFNLRGEADWGLGSFVVYGSFGFILATWKTGGNAVGLEAWLEFGFKIDLFSVFNFGAEVKMLLTYLGIDPSFTKAEAEFRIKTPWWLPDATFRFSKTWNESRPFDVAMVSRSLSSASAYGAADAEHGAGWARRGKETPLLVPRLSDDQSDFSHLYAFNDLQGIDGNPITNPENRTDIPTVATDSAIVLNFTNPVSNETAIGQDTENTDVAIGAEAGVQRVQDLSAHYRLKSIAVRRTPRYGAEAGTWDDLLAAEDSVLDVTGGGTALVTPTLKIAWDADLRADGNLEPKRLILNGVAPYTITIGGPQNDEEALANDPGFPCCDPEPSAPANYVLNFDADQPRQLPRRQRFSPEGAWWQWATIPTPLAGPGVNISSAEVAFVRPDGTGTIGWVDLPLPAVSASITLSLFVGGQGTLVFEGYAGLDLVVQQTIDLGPSLDETTFVLETSFILPMTSIVLRSESAVLGTEGDIPGWVEVLEVTYRTLADVIRIAASATRCLTTGGAGAQATGVLAFLPNHVYEVMVTTEIEVAHTSEAGRRLTLSEPCYFQTKGLPGLNLTPNTGDELRPYVETTYPLVSRLPVYREEPIAIAFTEGLSTLLPVNRVLGMSGTAEQTQLMELVLNVDRVGSPDGLERMTVSTADWITEHRDDPDPPPWPKVAEVGDQVLWHERAAPSLEPISIRWEGVVASSPNCEPVPLPTSQVLLHLPIDADGSQGSWQPRTGFRSTVRAKNGPYTERHGFDGEDVGAFSWQLDGGATSLGDWQVSDDGALHAPMADTGRQYASFGETSWDHLQVRVQLDPGDGAAGIGVGVAEGTTVRQALLALVEPGDSGRNLVVRRIANGEETELDRRELSNSVGTVTLTVTLFDDYVRATVGDVTIEEPRETVRSGRVSMVASGEAAFTQLLVDGLDMYQFDFSSSRFRSFEEHIKSYHGVLTHLPVAAFGGAPIQFESFLAERSSVLNEAMRPNADPQRRQSLFSEFLGALEIPLRQRVDCLCISRVTDRAGTLALLLETPEPITFSREVTVRLVMHPSGGEANSEIQLLVLSNGDETTAQLIPVDRAANALWLKPGKYTLDFSLDRERWRTTTDSDPASRYQQNQAIELSW